MPRLKESEPSVFRRAEGIVDPSEADRMRDECQDTVRRACDAFKEACEGADDESEVRYAAAKDMVKSLWRFAPLRGRAFQDLVGLLEAALDRADLAKFIPTQLDVLRQAFADLRKWFLDDDVVERHIDNFAEHDIDVLGPLRDVTPKRVRVTFEELD